MPTNPPTPEQNDRLDKILNRYRNFWICPNAGPIANTDDTKRAIQAMILEARIQEIERKYVLHADLMSSKDYKDGFDAACDYIDDSHRLRIADLKAQLEQLKGVRG
jgi:hypothetical protein